MGADQGFHPIPGCLGGIVAQFWWLAELLPMVLECGQHPHGRGSDHRDAATLPAPAGLNWDHLIPKILFPVPHIPHQLHPWCQLHPWKSWMSPPHGSDPRGGFHSPPGATKSHRPHRSGHVYLVPALQRLTQVHTTSHVLLKMSGGPAPQRSSLWSPSPLLSQKGLVH